MLVSLFWLSCWKQNIWLQTELVMNWFGYWPQEGKITFSCLTFKMPLKCHSGESCLKSITTCLLHGCTTTQDVMMLLNKKFCVWRIVSQTGFWKEHIFISDWHILLSQHGVQDALHAWFWALWKEACISRIQSSLSTLSWFDMYEVA